MAVQYHLDKFPPRKLEWERLIPLIGPANAALARYDGTLLAIPNAAVLLSPLMTQEAVLSSRIEGTQATMGEVLEFEAAGEKASTLSEQKKGDIVEVLNYRKAMRRAQELLQTLPLCQRVVCEGHQVLLDGVRGQNKAPGAYRRIPNWIGPQGCPIEEARYVPISAEKLPDAMGEWEKFIHADAPDKLVQLAILHAEFEALHPFLDGNGRLGRMLVPLFMAYKGLLREPMFYISAFFERNREEYYERLLAVSEHDAWTDWIAFFLKAVREQALENQNKANAIVALYMRYKGQFSELTRSLYSINALDFIFKQPIFKSTDFVTNSGIPRPTAMRISKLLRDKGILLSLQVGKGRREGVYACRELLNIAEGMDVL
ncbi:MAG: Fic/DOC family N-terminal domain-containing protein [Kiritimatiellia bacterium]|jgi:Fic family protein|nr:Fic/DOC family N-terminal domain-containing protein [Kiritimatiellia bacterium]MDD4172726.1 Fic/DOC family N-terminal domain-containing protein [Kiritimatiellia bacterium]MDD4440792.1 Fic/DOC family N-terminal domain-containing protein [Kiritimatiellia bacterium]MDX9792128.1 Fic/DOC family N-terminal domain-containing protein [Kiritimatiellia bacterium]